MNYITFSSRRAALGVAFLALTMFRPMAWGQGGFATKSPAANLDQSTPTTPAQDLPLAYPFGGVSRWLAQVQSFRLRAECRDERSPAGIAKSLRQIKNQFPGLLDPDPLVFTELLPVQFGLVEDAFDQKRLRSFWNTRTGRNLDLSRSVRIWDGKQALMHEHYLRSNQNSYRLAPKPDRVVESMWGYVTYLSKQPPVFWWNKGPAAQKEFAQGRGTPADYVVVGREKFHGVECDVWLSSLGHQADRYYVGVQDRRWYGAKEGIIVPPPDFVRTYQHAVEAFLGKKFGDPLSDSAWAEIDKTLRTMPREKKMAWCRLHYARLAKDYRPVFEYWFADFRELGQNRVFPFREDFLFYDHEDQKEIFVSTTRRLTIKEISIDRPLEDRLFTEPLTEGAMVVDEMHKPRLIYKHKAKFTPEEWQAIVTKATAEDAEATARRQRMERLLGKPAPPLPAGVWLNSQPLNWAKLRGKIVVLKFWSIACVPCYNEIATLRGPDGSDQPPQPSEQQASPIPIVFIGVHAPGRSREEIEKVLRKYKLRAPICIDRQGPAEAPGEFFGQCAVDAMPTSIAVDEEGRILAHGSLDEAITAAAHRRRQISEKKKTR